MEVRIVVDETHLTLILPRIMDDTVIPWEEAWTLGCVIEQAGQNIPSKIAAVSDRLGINVFRDRAIVLLFYHTDRIRISKDMCSVVASRLKKYAQDVQFLLQGVNLANLTN